VPNEKTLRDNLIDLTNGYGRDIPPDVLEQYGIAKAEYEVWRLHLPDEDIKERKILEDAAKPAPPDALPPRRTKEEVAAIEQGEREREELLRRSGERQGQAEWEDDEEEPPA
jgi:hypothetical protein